MSNVPFICGKIFVHLVANQWFLFLHSYTKYFVVIHIVVVNVFVITECTFAVISFNAWIHIASCLSAKHAKQAE